jgi:hypothetical protein
LWCTYKQAAELGGQVRKGEKGSLVVYADTVTRKDTDAKGAEVETEIPFMKGYTVFNAEQIDGLAAHFYATVAPLNSDIERLESVEGFFASTKASIQRGGSSAFYSPERKQPFPLSWAFAPILSPSPALAEAGSSATALSRSSDKVCSTGVFARPLKLSATYRISRNTL